MFVLCTVLLKKKVKFKEFEQIVSNAKRSVNLALQFILKPTLAFLINRAKKSTFYSFFIGVVKWKFQIKPHVFLCNHLYKHLLFVLFFYFYNTVVCYPKITCKKLGIIEIWYHFLKQTKTQNSIGIYSLIYILEYHFDFLHHVNLFSP